METKTSTRTGASLVFPYSLFTPTLQPIRTHFLYYKHPIIIEHSYSWDFLENRLWSNGYVRPDLQSHALDRTRGNAEDISYPFIMESCFGTFSDDLVRMLIFEMMKQPHADIHLIGLTIFVLVHDDMFMIIDRHIESVFVDPCGFPLFLLLFPLRLSFRLYPFSFSWSRDKRLTVIGSISSYTFDNLFKVTICHVCYLLIYYRVVIVFKVLFWILFKHCSCLLEELGTHCFSIFKVQIMFEGSE